jgi:hypothetical protein
MFASRSTPWNPVRQVSEAEAVLRSSSTYQVHTSTTKVHTKYILVCTVYVLSTYSVQDYARCIPRLCNVEVLQLCLLWSTNSVHTWYGTLLHWYTTCYSTVQPCSALHRYIPPCNAVHNPEDFFILIWYSVHPNLHSANCCADLDVLSTKLKWRNLQDHEQHYKEVCTSAEQNKRFCAIACGVPMQHCANWVLTCLYMELQNLYKHIPRCTWTVLGMYLLVRTLKNQKMNEHNVENRTVDLMHSILCAIPLCYQSAFHGVISG